MQILSDELRLWMEGMEQRLAAKCEACVDKSVGQWKECQQLLQHNFASLQASVKALQESSYQPLGMGSSMNSEAAAEPAASKVRKSQSKGTRNFEEGEIWEKGEGDGGDSTDSEDAADRVNLTNAVERTQKMLSARVSNAVTHYVGSPAEDSYCTIISESSLFSVLCLVMTALACATAAAETELETSIALDQAAGVPHGEYELARFGLFIFTRAFLGWMVLELAVNFLGQRSEFFLGPSKGWNLFDVIVLVISIVEVSITGSSLRFVRIFRAARSLRLLRAFRVFRHSVSLQKFTGCLVPVALSMLWALVFGLSLAYVFGLAMMDGVAQFVSDPEGPLSPVLVEDLRVHYGGLLRTFSTLFRGISGADWTVLAAPLEQTMASASSMWALYVCLLAFGVLNILTGGVVCAIMRPVTTERLLVTEEEAKEERELNQVLAEGLAGMGREALTAKSFKALVELPSMVKKLLEFGIDIQRTPDAFELIDADHVGRVNVETAARRLLSLRGQASSHDLNRLKRDVSHMRHHIVSIRDAITTLTEHEEERDNFGNTVYGV